MHETRQQSFESKWSWWDWRLISRKKRKINEFKWHNRTSNLLQVCVWCMLNANNPPCVNTQEQASYVCVCVCVWHCLLPGLFSTYWLKDLSCVFLTAESLLNTTGLRSFSVALRSRSARNSWALFWETGNVRHYLIKCARQSKAADNAGLALTWINLSNHIIWQIYIIYIYKNTHVSHAYT